MANSLGKAKKGRGKSSFTNKHKKSVAEIVNYIIENADIIIEVLDSRFIEKTRQKEIENKAESLGKKVIYVLNKSDLADTGKISRETELESLKPYIFFSSKKRRGTRELRKLINMEAKKSNKDAVNVGVIGYPNTGKSSLINMLSGKSSAKVSSESGYTKSIQKIRLFHNVYLIDTPGIISEDENPLISENAAKHSKIGAVTWDRTKDPEMVVDRIMSEHPGVLEKYYGIESKGDSEVLIEILGRKLKHLKKGNAVDEMRTAKKILRDWQEGKIKIFS